MLHQPGRSCRISLCIPHWQVRDMMSICLRSIRKHSRKYDLEVIVVDNGSRDHSLDYLRGLSWIRLIERPEEFNRTLLEFLDDSQDEILIDTYRRRYW